MKEWLQLEADIPEGEFRRRDDIPAHLVLEVYSIAVRGYRMLFWDEPEWIHRIEKATAIGMLERAIRDREPL